MERKISSAVSAGLRCETHGIRKPLGKDALAAIVRAAKESPHPQFDLYRQAFPGQIGTVDVYTGCELAAKAGRSRDSGFPRRLIAAPSLAGSGHPFSVHSASLLRHREPPFDFSSA
jgi:hypothetical protein